MDDGDYLKAIEYFDKALEISPQYRPPIFNKAKAYYYAGMYEDALRWFNKSKFSWKCIDNYVILSWIGDTLNELNRFDEAIKAYLEAIDIINEDYEKTIKFHKEQRWNPPSDSYLKSLLDEKNKRVSSMKDSIDYSKKLKKETHIKPKNDFNDQEKFLNSIGKENLITITGTFFYDNPQFEKGMILNLIKEENNEFDSDAIAVYLNDVKVGYVANSERTCCYLTSKASDIQIQDISIAEYISYFAYRHHIAQIIK